MEKDLEQHIKATFSTALERGYIQPYFQPVVRSISRKLCSFEALARWIDPDYGFIRPDQFIPVLEQMHAIHLLDIHVARTACATIRQTVERGDIPVPISINLSRLDFVLCDIFDEINQAVIDYHIPHDFLYVEITESLMAEQGSGMHEVIERFRSAGFQIWMDDFGSGYSSLNVLKDFSFEEIKLDMKFLSSFDQRSRRIMTAVIQMAKEIGIHTLAEGVETEEQFMFLRNIGCEKVQGYFFGRPLPYTESLEHMSSIGAEIERPAERAYYDSIGKVDFLSAVPFMTQEEKDSLVTARQLNSIPLAVAEARADSFSVLFYNTAFEKTARGTGLVSNIFSQELLCKPQPYTLLPKRVINLMDSTRSGIEGRMFFISNEEYYEIQAKCVAQSREAYCVLFRMSNLSKVSKSRETNELDEGLRQLYALFERVTLLDVATDSIMPLYVDTQENLVSGRSGIKRLHEEYAEQLIFPSDQKAFLEFVDMSNIESRLKESGDESVSTVLRTSVRHGRYAWKRYTILRLRPSAYLVLISNVDREVIGLFKRGDAAPRQYGFDSQENGWTVSEEFVWNTLLNSGIVRFFWKDKDRRFLGASRGFLDYYGFSSVDDICGKTDEELGWHVQPGQYMNDEMLVIHEGVTTHNEPGHCIAMGENRDILASKTPLYDVNGQIRGLVGYFIDKDQLEANDSRGGETKRRDILTGLLNSRGIHEEAQLFRDEYYLRGVDFIRVSMDIDDIDSINTQYGYDFGDKAIAKLGSELKCEFGVTAAVARMSGHQFTIMCQVRGNTDDGLLRARVRSVADRVRQVDGVPLTLYVSVGSCRFSEVESLEEQAKKAEVRLLADHDEHISVTERQSRAAKIFHMYDDLPISYSVYKVTLGDDGQVDDATMFYVNHAFEKRGNLTASEILGKSTRELFPTMGPDWYDIVRRAAFEGEIITDKLYYEPTGHTYFMTASPVIHSGYCCFTYQELDV